MEALPGKRVVIIGGSSGIGLDIARHLLSKGMEVTLASRNVAKLERARRYLDRPVDIFPLDASDDNQVKQFFEQLEPFDHLVTTSGTVIKGPLIDLDFSDITQTIENKLHSQILATKYGINKIRAGGSITLFSGAFSQKSFVGTSIMTAINCAVEGFAKALALEVAPIRVNAISPGYIDTPIRQWNSEEEKIEFFKQVEEKLPLKRMGVTEDISELVDYLIHSKYTTGTVNYIDGGLSLT
ncbi:SDR family oxidoreductase [Photobacterium sagamiensis]|uniref:SDR family oxidoreductase n=1 Tax=Photobacterium sagamiensis TaxID=2910241 RepID=UPI003D0F623C